MQWLSLKYPLVHRTSFSIPNGGLRSHAEGKRQVVMGLKAGVPDVLIAYPSDGWAGLFIEFKFGDNGLSDKQLLAINDLIEAGYCCAICYTVEEAMETVQFYLKEGRADDVQRRTIETINNPPYLERLSALQPGSRRINDGDMCA